MRKGRKSRIIGKFNIPLEIIIGCGGGLIVLLGLIHVVLVVINVGKLAQHKALQMQYEAMRTDKENVDTVVSQMRDFQGKYSVLSDIIEKGEMSWARNGGMLGTAMVVELSCCPAYNQYGYWSSTSTWYSSAVG